jgi:hypothetical protein
VVTTYGEYPISGNIASLDYYKRLHGHCDLSSARWAVWSSSSATAL